VSIARKGIKPTPVAVNKAIMDRDERCDWTARMDTLAVFDLGRYFNPKPLFLCIMKVDELRQEENYRCAPENCDRSAGLEVLEGTKGACLLQSHRRL
jgi:hypothetical protein